MKKGMIKKGVKRIKDSPRKSVDGIKKGVSKIKQSKPAQKVSKSVKAVKKKAHIEESQEIRNFIKLPDYFTLANAFSGIAAMFFAFSGFFLTSIMFMFISVILDKVDGTIARKIQRKGDFGKEIDSLADIIAFGVAPVIFGMAVLNSLGMPVSLKETPFALIALLLFLSAGILRLARYNVSVIENYFYGMPITLNALVIPFAFLMNTKAVFYPYLYLLLGFLMITPFKIKKFM